MSDTSDDRGVSPVVGVILVVAITVVLSASIGMFVFNLGTSLSQGGSQQAEIATSVSHPTESTAVVQVVTGNADELRVLVDGSEAGTIPNPSPGDTVEVSASRNSKITIIAVSAGESTLVSSSSGGSGSGNTDVVTNGLVAYYKLDGDASDSAGSNDGTISGATSTTDPYRGDVFAFDGTDDSIVASSFPQQTGNLTVSYWVNDTASSDNIHLQLHTSGQNENANNIGIAASNSDYGFFSYDTSGGTNFNNISQKSAVRDGSWKHIVITQSGDPTASPTITAYINGSQIAQFTPTTGIHMNNTGSLYLGMRADSNHYGKLVLDNVRVYNRTLSAQEAQDIYSAEK